MNQLTAESQANPGRQRFAATRRSLVRAAGASDADARESLESLPYLSKSLMTDFFPAICPKGAQQDSLGQPPIFDTPALAPVDHFKNRGQRPSADRRHSETTVTTVSVSQ